jgi:hypothetical protein
MNETIEKIKAARKENKKTKIFLKKTDIVSVFRFVKNSLNDRNNGVEMTVSDAIKYKQWDTCRGTMGYIITFEDTHGNRLDVSYDGKCYVMIYPDYSIPEEDADYM